MDERGKSTAAFGIPADNLRDLCRQDAALNELVTDYQTLSRELRDSRATVSETDKKFWSDSLETLHALDGEIRRCLSRVDHDLKKKEPK